MIKFKKYSFILLLASYTCAMKHPAPWDIKEIADQIVQKRRKTDLSLLKQFENIGNKSFFNLTEDEKESIVQLARKAKNGPIITALLNSYLFLEKAPGWLKPLNQLTKTHSPICEEETLQLKNRMLKETIIKSCASNAAILLEHGADSSAPYIPNLYKQPLLQYGLDTWNNELFSAFVRFDKNPNFKEGCKTLFSKFLKLEGVINGKNKMNILLFHSYPRPNINKLKKVRAVFPFIAEFLMHAHARRTHRLAQFLTRSSYLPTEITYHIAEYRYGVLTTQDWDFINKYARDDYKKQKNN